MHYWPERTLLCLFILIAVGYIVTGEESVAKLFFATFSLISIYYLIKLEAKTFYVTLTSEEIRLSPGMAGRNAVKIPWISIETVSFDYLEAIDRRGGITNVPLVRIFGRDGNSFDFSQLVTPDLKERIKELCAERNIPIKRDVGA